MIVCTAGTAGWLHGCMAWLISTTEATRTQMGTSETCTIRPDKVWSKPVGRQLFQPWCFSFLGPRGKRTTAAGKTTWHVRQPTDAHHVKYIHDTVHSIKLPHVQVHCVCLLGRLQANILKRVKMHGQHNALGQCKNAIAVTQTGCTAKIRTQACDKRKTKTKTKKLLLSSLLWKWLQNAEDLKVSMHLQLRMQSQVGGWGLGLALLCACCNMQLCRSVLKRQKFLSYTILNSKSVRAPRVCLMAFPALFPVSQSESQGSWEGNTSWARDEQESGKGKGGFLLAWDDVCFTPTELCFPTLKYVRFSFLK